MILGRFGTLQNLHRAERDIISSIRKCVPEGSPEEEGSAPPNTRGEARDLDSAAVDFEHVGRGRVPTHQTEERGIESSGPESFPTDFEEHETNLGLGGATETRLRTEDSFSESESYTSFDITVSPTAQDREKELYSTLSPDFGVLINTSFNPKKDYCSERLWSLLERLALPGTKRYLIRYIRHCTFASEQWLSRVLRFHIDTGNKTPSQNRRRERHRKWIIPTNFETVLRPLLEKIVKKVRHRRWRCCVSKKYIDSLCMYTLSPTFHYDVNTKDDALSLDETVDADQDPPRAEGRAFPCRSRPVSSIPRGVLRVNVSTRQPGDPFRRVSKEVNISRDSSGEATELSPLLWQLELRLIAILYLDSDWVGDTTTVQCFPQLADSRILFSVYKKEECTRPILSYNVSQLRNAIGRLYGRWNDLAPSRDLYDYFCFLRDRVSILSISSLCHTIDRSVVPIHPPRGVRRGGRFPAASSITPRGHVLSKPTAIDPVYAFGKYVGKNMKDVIESVTKISVDELDLGEFSFDSKGAGADFSDKEHEEDTRQANARLETARRKYTEGQRLTIAKRKRLYRMLTRKQKLREMVNKKIVDHRSTFGEIAEEGDYRNAQMHIDERLDTTHDFLGDTHEEPPVVRNALRRLGGDLFSSSEEESWSESLSEEENHGVGKSRYKKKGDTSSISTASGSKASGPVAPSDENFFRHYANGDERTYAQLGKKVKDEDICAEMATHHLIASIKNDARGGTENHPCIQSDTPALFTDVFLSCLTTETFLTHSPKSLPEGETRPRFKTVKCITRTNHSFMSETHAMMSQIEQEIQSWSMLDSISSCLQKNSVSCFSGIGNRDDMAWKILLPPEVRDAELGERDPLLSKGESLHLPEYDDDPDAMIEYAIEFERSKIENVLKMFYSFSRGKRNQFIHRNIREEAFSNFLNPGESEFLLLVCGLKNSSIVPSIIVSRLRQNDVDRLSKIIDEMTIYDIIEEFALFNELSIQDRNIASHKHAKYLFEVRCCGKHAIPIEDTFPCIDIDDTPHGSGHISGPRSARGAMHLDSIETLTQSLAHFSLRDALDAHLSHSLGQFLPQARDRNVHSSVDEDSVDGEDAQKKFSIFPSDAILRKMYGHDKTHRFLSPDISVPWQSPRGLVRVVRIVLIRCINFFMKEINHLIDARAFFFNPWMTIQLCNTPTFVKLRSMRQELMHNKADSASEHEESSQHEMGGEGGEEEEERIPTRREIASLFSAPRTLDEEETPRHEIETETAPSYLSYSMGTSEHTSEPRMLSFSSDFLTHMRSRIELHCMDFYHQCPIVLHCMTGCFLWNPSTCTSSECVGADSFLGLHAWLYEMTRHISAVLIPELLVQNALYIESAKSQTWVSTDDSFLLVAGAEDLCALYARTRSTYRGSKYMDRGMHYKYLLMLLSNMPFFGNRGSYSTMTQHVCTFVVQMNVMLFPHILESFSIHIQQPPQTYQSQGTSSCSKYKQARPVDPEIRYTDICMEDEEEEDDDGPLGVSMFYPTPMG